MNKDGIINELEKILEKLETALENCSNIQPPWATD